MNEFDKMEMLEQENHMLKAELRETLNELALYKERFGDLSGSAKGGSKMDFKKILRDSKEKLQEKMKDEQVKDKVEKGKDLSEKAKKKMLEGSNMAVDAFKTAKNVLFNKELKDNLKEEYEKQRKERSSKEEDKRN